MHIKKLCTSAKPQLELTLAILKPDVCRNPIVCKTIKQLMLNNGFYFVRSVVTQLRENEAEMFYSEHKEKFFFTRLVSFMSSGLISAHIIARENAINHWRKMMGPTKVYKARHEDPNCIRAQFGLTDTRNATHGADSLHSAQREIKFFIPDFNFDEWLREEEPYFRDNHNIEFLPHIWQHQIKNYRNILSSN